MVHAHPQTPVAVRLHRTGMANADAALKACEAVCMPYPQPSSKQPRTS